VFLYIISEQDRSKAGKQGDEAGSYVNKKRGSNKDFHGFFAAKVEWADPDAQINGLRDNTLG
jgi:hypothetical protein